MSGGYFDYHQHRITDIANDIDAIVVANVEGSADDWKSFSKETIDEFKVARDLLKKAAIYAQRIDYLLSGDDGEETFHKRLRQELTELTTREEKA